MATSMNGWVEFLERMNEEYHRVYQTKEHDVAFEEMWKELEAVWMRN